MRRTRGTTARLLSVLLAVVAAGWLGSVAGLYPGEKVTVQGLTRDSSGALWTSWPSFTAESGTLDLARAVPEAGTYQVADAGGLLWSSQPPATGSQVRHIGGPGNGFTVQVRVLIGGEVVAEQTLTRSVPQPARNLDVASTAFHGSLYLPSKPTASPATPAVVVIGGSEGGVPTPEAAAFAAAGYPSPTRTPPPPRAPGRR